MRLLLSPRLAGLNAEAFLTEESAATTVISPRTVASLRSTELDLGEEAARVGA